jgi:hypothetical protein
LYGANPEDWVLGLAPYVALRRHVETLEKATAERFEGRADTRYGAALYSTRGRRPELASGRAHLSWIEPG